MHVSHNYPWGALLLIPSVPPGFPTLSEPRDMQTIRNFLLTQMPETVEADEEETDGSKNTESIAKVFSPWATLDSIRTSFSNQGMAERRPQYRNQAAMDAARDLT